MKIKKGVVVPKWKLSQASYIKKLKSQKQSRIGSKCVLVPKCMNKCHKIDRAPEPCNLEEQKHEYRDMMVAIFGTLMLFDIRMRYLDNYSLHGMFFVGLLIVVDLVLTADVIWEKLIAKPEPTLFEQFKNWFF